MRIRSSSSHRIFDLEKKTVHETKKGVHIGRHVWLAAQVHILGGTDIGRDCIVGANSLVNKAFPSNVMIAGQPAKIIRKNVDWDMNSFCTWEEYEQHMGYI